MPAMLAEPVIEGGFLSMHRQGVFLFSNDDVVVLGAESADVIYKVVLIELCAAVWEIDHDITPG
jgi:hypothetical protein